MATTPRPRPSPLPAWPPPPCAAPALHRVAASTKRARQEQNARPPPAHPLACGACSMSTRGARPREAPWSLTVPRAPPTPWCGHRYLQGVLTLKHYVANSLDNTVPTADVTVDGQHYRAGVEVNRHTVDVHVPNFMLQEYLGAFRSAARAGAKGMMCSYNRSASPVLCRRRLVAPCGPRAWRVRGRGHTRRAQLPVADAVPPHAPCSMPHALWRIAPSPW